MHIILPRDAGTTVGQGGVKEFRAMQTLQKPVTNCACFRSSTMLTSKIIAEIIENHSEVYGCANSCNKFVSIRFW